MSISSSLSNALSGLTAVARQADLVSANLANATNPNYARREVELSARDGGTQGGGVTVDGVTRVVDRALLSDRRHADADIAYASTRQSFFTAVEAQIGLPTEASSLSARVADFETKLIAAGSQPASDAHLSAVLSSAKSITDKVNSISDGLQSMRMDADAAIARSVGELNTKLTQIRDLNFDIARRGLGGHSTAALEDHRAELIDDVSKIVPLREVEGENGQIALFTTGGTQLLSGQVSEISFNPAGIIVPHMTLSNGLLSGLEINGRPIDAETGLGGGSLAAHFEVRDVDAVRAQTQIDGLARDLVERFQDPTVDTTLLPGDAGLFTDNGAVFDPVNEVGLANRLSVNANADPAQGGSTWRLRDGLNAIAEGSVGDASRLNLMADALRETRATVSGGFSATARSVETLTADYLSDVGRQKLETETEQIFATTQRTGLRSSELDLGVNTDDEMQKLLLIEQAYAANARVIQTIDEMIDALMRI